MRRLAVVVVVVAMPLAAAGLVGCGFSGEGDFEPIRGEDILFGLDQTSTTTTSTTTTTVATTPPDSSTPAPTTTLVQGQPIDFYFVIDGQLQRQVVSVSDDRDAPLQQVVSRLEAGPPAGEQSVGLTTAVRPGLIADVSIARGVATIDLSGDVLNGIRSTDDQRDAIAQIVLTMTSLGGVGQAVFTIDGAPAAIPVPANDNEDSEPGEALTFEDFEIRLVRRTSPTTTTTTTTPPTTTDAPVDTPPATQATETLPPTSAPGG